MQRETQERLVGATLLIVAGVVLIPWLLDGSVTEPGTSEQELVLPGGTGNGNETRTISLEVPQAERTPSSRAVEIDSRSVRSNAKTAMSLPAPGQSSGQASEPASGQAVDELAKSDSIKVPERFAKPMPSGTSDTISTSKENKPATVEPVQAKPAPTKPEPIKPAPTQTKPVVASTTPKQDTSSTRRQEAPKPAPAAVSPATTTPAAQQGWAVQVGSFASKDNAERLAKKLRDKSYKAFVMRNVIDGRVLFRVRVGPVKQRNQADLLATALREDRQPARVLSHP